MSLWVVFIFLKLLSVFCSFFFDEQEIEKDITSIEMYRAFNKVDWPLTLFLPNGADLNVVNKFLHNSEYLRKSLLTLCSLCS